MSEQAGCDVLTRPLAVSVTAAGRERLAAGLSSGTSADGIDAALVAIRGDGADTSLRLVRFAGCAYARELREAVLAAARGESATAIDFARLDAAIGEVFARTALRLVRDAGHGADALDFIASHGQTIAHVPQPHGAHGQTVRATWQMGSLAVIAERTGVTTVGNFRVRDVAAGGEGAPLLPYVDWVLFRSTLEGRMLLNIGGIANVTFLPQGGAPDDVVAYDLGPGNMILDGLMRELTEGRETQDTGGKLARRGSVARDLLDELFEHPFFDRPPPRSTGREEFGAEVIERILARGSTLHAADLLATATAFTVRAVRREIIRWAPRRGGGGPEHAELDDDGEEAAAMEELAREFPVLYVSGGGAENPVMMDMLRDLLKPVRVRRFDELGLPSRAREAVSFAVLGNECLAGNPANLPRVTGARRRVILGEVVRACGKAG